MPTVSSVYWTGRSIRLRSIIILRNREDE